MIALSHKELEKDLLVSFETNVPAMIYGKIGIGKSDTIRKVSQQYSANHNLEYREWSNIPNDIRVQLASDKGDLSKKFILFDIRAAGLDPSDIKGLPNLSGTYVNWLPDIVFKVASRKDFNGIIFFDEVNQAVPTVQSALYQVILDNTAGTIKLSDNCIRIAAGNRSKDKSNVNNLSMALQARFTNTELACPSSKEWSDNYARNNNVNLSVISYLQYQPDHIYTEIDQIKDQRNFANPRNWTRLSKQLNFLNTQYPTKSTEYYDRLERLAEWNIGGEPAIKFSAYCRLHESVDHKKILANPETIRALPIDQKWFVLDMIASEYGKEGKKLIEPVAEILLHIDGDLAVNTYQNCTSFNKLFPSQFRDSQNGMKWAAKNLVLLKHGD